MTMVTKTEKTGSQAIREYLAAHGDAKPKEIQEELEKQGIKVSNALIQKVKHRWAQAHGNGKAKAKPKVTKSQAIRERLSQHPDASRAETAAAVAKRLGVKVTPKDVSQTKYEMKKQAAKPKKKAATMRKEAKPAIAKESEAASMGKAVDDLAAAKTLAERLGGIDKAKRTLDLLAKLT